jgi:cytidine deaminase
VTLDAVHAAHAAVADDPRLERLIPAAIAVMRRAYAPYSHFRVGAALLTRSGEVFVGCNVENASYPAALCAERGAVMSALAQGHRDFELVVIATEAEEPSPPCGQCRQVLAEFAPGLEVVSIVHDGVTRRWTMNELLPSPFLPDSLREHHGPGSLTEDR